MDSPTKPAPPVIDRPDVSEALCDCFLGAAYMEGLVVLTFGVERIVPGNAAHNAPTYKVVKSRIALTASAFDHLVKAIPKLQLAAVPPSPGSSFDKPN